MTDVQELQRAAPKGVVFTADPDEVPYYSLRPNVRTPLRRQDDGQVDFILLVQNTKSNSDRVVSIPDALGINGDSQIGLSRANRIMPPGQTSFPATAADDKCNLDRDIPRAAFAVDNIRPFGPLLHKLVASSKHREALSEVSVDEVLDATELFYEISAQDGRSNGHRLDGLTIGMNFGDYARSGASQIHFHYQVAGLGKANYNAGDRLGALCEAYRDCHAGADYLGDYLRAVRAANLVLLENEQALAYAPISPRFKAEAQVMLKREQAGNILDTTPDERAALADLQWQIMQRYGRLDCHALNQVWYMTRFSAANDYNQRLVISLCPRTSIFAFYELSGNNVIDVLPWTTARTLRAAADIHFRLRA
jgi:galactose-1-phosphate uridylyltransferase